MKVRILTATRIDGIDYKADDIADLSAEEIAAAKDQGVADDNEAAVAYAESLAHGAEPA